MSLISIFIGLCLATGTSAQSLTTKVSPTPSSTVAAAPTNFGGFAPCPPGVLCPILPRDHVRRQVVVTVTNEDCAEDHMSSALPVVPESTQTVIVCPPEGCGQASTAAPVEATSQPAQQRVGVCPPEECPECSPDVCQPCTAAGDCPSCDGGADAGCLPICPDYCPPAPEAPLTTALSTPLPVVPTPTFMPIFSTSVVVPGPVETATETANDVGFEQGVASAIPSAAADRRAHPAPGVYMGMAAVFVAINWM
ncbi:uncharacterized protein F5Z01DRAFT_638784 [Emericellopsis atlantica]|uniref:Uncharacterized protein n=1 Tax=Emericellopsis atlantica TaxID=2614577 RepID=A0A9P7ZHK2_9HYPO|nr:uncharacterized protein F5Z01DRAFT_638784 [Emericellopsis atlantica]KAG9252145.1 hypothetical protein F5Z01DRAFT_638784 [Emericellopsis atlantica]